MLMQENDDDYEEYNTKEVLEEALFRNMPVSQLFLCSHPKLHPHIWNLKPFNQILHYGVASRDVEIRIQIFVWRISNSTTNIYCTYYNSPKE